MSGENKVVSFIKDCLAGGTAGAISKTVAAPLERVKLLLQTQDANKALEGKKYTGFFNCMGRVYKEEGFASYWRGNWANIVRYFPTTALNFGFKGFFNSVFPKYDADTRPVAFILSKVAAGGCAGASCMMFVYPLDFARTRMGVDVSVGGKRQFNGLADCLKSIFKSDGIGGLYQGIGISMGSIFLYRGLYFGGYDTGKRLFPGYQDWNLFYKFLFAQAITNFSEVISYPFDTIRRRLMMNSGLKEKLYANSMDATRKIYQEGGVPAFFKGNLSNMIRSVSSSLVLVLYDEFKKVISSPTAK